MLYSTGILPNWDNPNWHIHNWDNPEIHNWYTKFIIGKLFKKTVKKSL